MSGQRITLHAEILGPVGTALEPQRHDSEAAKRFAAHLCNALVERYSVDQDVRPETLAIAVQTVVETLLGACERQGLDAATMRVALANSLLVNGNAKTRIDVDGDPIPTIAIKARQGLH